MAHFINQKEIEEKKRATHRERWRAEIRKSLLMPTSKEQKIQAKEQLKRIEQGREYTSNPSTTPGAISKDTKRYASCCRLKK